MSRRVAVLLGEECRLVGTLYYEQQGARQRSAFAYDDAWLRAPRPWQIEPALPLVSGSQYHPVSADTESVFHRIIADTEPDGWGRRVILRDHQKRRQAAREHGASDLPPLLGAMDYLLAVDDHSRIGALRFQDESGAICCAAPEAGRRAPPLVELSDLVAASHRLERNSETARDLEYLRGRGTSLGGIRPKCSVLDDDGTLAIGKFPSVGDQLAVTKAEVLALHLAKQAGITAADARVVNSDGSDVALVRRFDRQDGLRCLYASAATMLQANAGDTVPHTYTEIVDVLRRYGDAPARDIEELWRRIAFSILITNVDDHLRNHGFLHVAEGRWRLSPAFDVNPFPNRVRELKTWVSEASGPEMRIEGLWKAVDYFGLTAATSAAILQQVESAVSRWQTVGRGVGMTVAELEPFAEAFEHSERDVARRLIARFS